MVYREGILLALELWLITLLCTIAPINFQKDSELQLHGHQWQWQLNQ